MAHGIAAAEGRAASAIMPSGLARVFILFGIIAATQGGGSVAVMAGFCRMLAVNLVQDSVSHVKRSLEKLWPVLQPGDRLVAAQRYLAVLLWLAT